MNFPLFTGCATALITPFLPDGRLDEPALRRLLAMQTAAKMDALLLVIRQASATGHGGRGDFHMDPAGRLSRRKPGHVAPFVYTGIQLVSRRLLSESLTRPEKIGMGLMLAGLVMICMQGF